MSGGDLYHGELPVDMTVDEAMTELEKRATIEGFARAAL